MRRKRSKRGEEVEEEGEGEDGEGKRRRGGEGGAVVCQEGDNDSLGGMKCWSYVPDPLSPSPTTSIPH